jgi:hypothetical protein
VLYRSRYWEAKEVKEEDSELGPLGEDRKEVTVEEEEAQSHDL